MEKISIVKLFSPIVQVKLILITLPCNYFLFIEILRIFFSIIGEIDRNRNNNFTIKLHLSYFKMKLNHGKMDRSDFSNYYNYNFIGSYELITNISLIRDIRLRDYILIKNSWPSNFYTFIN